VGPLDNLTLGGASADGVRAADITAPVSDFTINGLTPAGISLEGIVLPDATSGRRPSGIRRARRSRWAP